MSRSVSLRAVLLLAGCLLPAHSGEIDATAVALKIAREHAAPQEWAAFQRDAESRYETWKINNFFGSRKNFLDDKLLTTATGVPSGKVETLKRFMFYLALYKVHREPPPWYIRHMAQRHGQEFLDLLEDFSWENLARRVRKKSDEVKAAEAAEKEAAKAAKRREKQERAGRAEDAERADLTKNAGTEEEEASDTRQDPAPLEASPAPAPSAPDPPAAPSAPAAPAAPLAPPAKLEPLHEGEAFASAAAESRAPDGQHHADRDPREAVAAPKP